MHYVLSLRNKSTSSSNLNWHPTFQPMSPFKHTVSYTVSKCGGRLPYFNNRKLTTFMADLWYALSKKLIKFNMEKCRAQKGGINDHKLSNDSKWSEVSLQNFIWLQLSSSSRQVIVMRALYELLIEHPTRMTSGYVGPMKHDNSPDKVTQNVKHGGRRAVVHCLFN